MMADFRTIVDVAPGTEKISHATPVLMMGSCFAENIGRQLLSRKFDVAVNPFGIVFNPCSIANTFDCLLRVQDMQTSDLVEHHGLWHAFSHHGRFSGVDKTQVLHAVNQSIANGNDCLKRAEFLVLTFGTAWVYVRNDNGEVAANCHKFPASFFERRILSVAEIVDRYVGLIHTLQLLRPSVRIVLTISPVRHLSDGAHGNQISKSTLVLAVNELVKLGLADYFPAYELMLDDLRDYRFYDNDMVHPSTMAVDYIFQKFMDTYFSTETKQLCSDVLKIQASLNHRPRNHDVPDFAAFKKEVVNNIMQLSRTYPYIHFTKELEAFEAL